jgi:hypothetical protein
MTDEFIAVEGALKIRIKRGVQYAGCWWLVMPPSETSPNGASMLQLVWFEPGPNGDHTQDAWIAAADAREGMEIALWDGESPCEEGGAFEHHRLVRGEARTSRTSPRSSITPAASPS